MSRLLMRYLFSFGDFGLSIAGFGGNAFGDRIQQSTTI
jgi:hypothetical protein